MLLGVAVKHPRPSTLHHVPAGIRASARHISHHAPITIRCARRNARLLLVAQIGQSLPRAVAKCLAPLRRINARQAHLDLLIRPRLAATGRQRVAVCYANDEAQGENQLRHDRGYLLLPPLGALEQVRLLALMVPSLQTNLPPEQ